MSYYVYAISSRTGNYIYVGLSRDPAKRIRQHNAGNEPTTRTRAPFDTILIEGFPTRAEARRREKQLKSGAGKEMLKMRRLFFKV